MHLQVFVRCYNKKRIFSLNVFVYYLNKYRLTISIITTFITI